MQKNLLKIIINSLIGFTLIFLWLKIVNIQEIITTLKNISLVSILPFFIFTVLAAFLRSIRLKLILKEFNIPLKNLTLLTFLSQLLSFLVPLRLGEISKGLYLSHNHKIPVTRSVTWVFIDRLIDFWFVLIFLSILIFLVPVNLNSQISNLILISLVIFSITIGGVIFLPDFFKKVVNFVKHLLIVPILKNYFARISYFIIDCTSLINTGGTNLIKIFTVTILAILSEAFAWYTIFLVVFNASLNFPQIFLGINLSELGYLIPSAPGYVGSVEASGLVVFHYLLGLDEHLSSAAIVLIHISTLVYVLIFGLLGLYKLDFRLSELIGKLKKG